MTALSVKRMARIHFDVVGSDPGATGVDIRELVNQAGHHLVSAYPWIWLEGRSVTLRPRAAVTLTDATWAEATRTLTKTGAFTAYSFLSADTVEVSDGTGATVGTYEVESRTSNDAIVLKTSIGAAANGQTDIDAVLPNDQIELPTDFDFQAITGYSMSATLLGMASMTGRQSMLDLRQFGGAGPSVGFWALISYVRTASTAGTQPVPRLELHPRAANSDEQLVIFYRGGWRSPLTDEEILSIPDWLNALYIEIFKAFALGNEEPEDGSTDARLAAMSQGQLWAAAIRRDIQTQPDLGRMGRGWMSESEGVPINRYDTSQVTILP